MPPEHAQRILAARAARDDADQAYRTAVVDALKAGASVREVAKVAGLSTNTVDRWGREGGWPTAAQKKAWDAAREANSEWNRRLRATEGLAAHVEPDDE